MKEFALGPWTLRSHSERTARTRLLLGVTFNLFSSLEHDDVQPAENSHNHFGLKLKLEAANPCCLLSFLAYAIVWVIRTLVTRGG